MAAYGYVYSREASSLFWLPELVFQIFRKQASTGPKFGNSTRLIAPAVHIVCTLLDNATHSSLRPVLATMDS
jgi:hypothetical protein